VSIMSKPLNARAVKQFIRGAGKRPQAFWLSRLERIELKDLKQGLNTAGKDPEAVRQVKQKRRMTRVAVNLALDAALLDNKQELEREARGKIHQFIQMELDIGNKPDFTAAIKQATSKIASVKGKKEALNFKLAFARHMDDMLKARKKFEARV